MPRNGAGVYSKATAARSPNTTITSSDYNADMDDLVSDLNEPRPVSAGGTGATSEAGARESLDVAQKQASPSDSTAGRGLVVGSFGLGGNAMTLPDFSVMGENEFVRTGTASTPGAPTTADVWVGWNVRKNSEEGFQFLVNTTSGAIRTRNYTSDAFGDWMAILRSETGHTARDVVSSGSDSNGTWVVWSDDTAECWFQSSPSVSMSVSDGFGGFRSAMQTWTYPNSITFTLEPVVVATAANATARGVMLGNIENTTCEFAFTAVSSVALSASRTANLYAKGPV
jgi:hypothetical protein